MPETTEVARCYLCGIPADMPDPITQSRLWLTGIHYTTPCGSEVELTAHMGCLQENKNNGGN